jgi:2-amino-4-hydroxy-6-hydroxymethyldihydropteridine diphosphokinase
MIVIALGSNLPSDAGPPEATIAAAIEELRHRDIGVVAVSPMYATPAWPDPSDPSFVNAAARLETLLEPDALMGVLESVEGRFGRVRGCPNAPRTLDIDLLDYNGVIRERNPTLPHPRMATRGFVLVPLSDIAPGWRHPILGKTIVELRAALPETERELPRMSSISTVGQ